MKAWVPLVSFCGLAIRLAGSPPAQIATAYRFEVASVKPIDFGDDRKLGRGCRGSDSRPASTGVVPLGRCGFGHVTLKELVSFAYGVKLEWVFGGPSWIDSSEYAIEAKADDTSVPAEAELKMMLQTLTTEEFHLKFHHENRDVPGYHLQVGKDGLKLHPTDPNAPPQRTILSSSGLSGPADMKSIAKAIEANVGDPVLDMTALSGRYDTGLNWAPMVGPRAGTMDTLPSIFTSIQNAGLHLEREVIRIDVIVVDSAEKPPAR